MSMFVSKNDEYAIISQNNISIALSHFGSEQIFDILDYNINNKFNLYASYPNIVESYEVYFKQILATYTSQEDVERIQDTRKATYLQILDVLCNRFGLSYSKEMNIDYYSLAYYLYSFLVQNFTQNIIGFFVNYIVKEKNNLYESLQLATRKKSKDINTLYNKKLYKNQKLAIINANIDYVITAITGFDFSFSDILNMIYMDKNIVRYIEENVSCITDFFKTQYLTLLNSNMRPIILNEIIRAIHNIAISEDVSINNIINK